MAVFPCSIQALWNSFACTGIHSILRMSRVWARTRKILRWVRYPSQDILNASLAAALLGFHNNDNLFSDESRVNGLWNGILTFALPTTGAPGSFRFCPEMIKGTDNRYSVADLARMQISAANPPTFRVPGLCFEGKSSDSGGTWQNIQNQINDWVTRAKIGTYGSIWAIGAKQR